MKPRRPIIDLDQPGRLRTPDVLGASGWSRSTLYNRIDEGKFPRAHKDGRLNWWSTREVKAALQLDGVVDEQMDPVD